MEDSAPSPYLGYNYYNSALHGTADKATCIAAIYQTGLKSMQAAWIVDPPKFLAMHH